MKQSKSLSEWISSRYVVVVRDEENLAERGRFTISYARFILALSGIILLFALLSFIIVTTLLAKWFDPRVEYMQANRTLIQLDKKVDSLNMQVALKDQYIQNIRSILRGDIPSEDDMMQQVNTRQVSAPVDLKQISAADSSFRKQFEETDYGIINNTRKTDELQYLFLFPPLQGIVSQAYDLQSGHFGIDIVAKKDEPIKSIADGTVVLSSWTQDAGLTIAIQHKNQLISFYKHNSVLLKKVGETVSTADLIAIIGNSGELTDGPHLHFELWHNLNPVDPEDFINFE